MSENSLPAYILEQLAVIFDWLADHTEPSDEQTALRGIAENNRHLCSLDPLDPENLPQASEM